MAHVKNIYLVVYEVGAIVEANVKWIWAIYYLYLTRSEGIILHKNI